MLLHVRRLELVVVLIEVVVRRASSIGREHLSFLVEACVGLADHVLSDLVKRWS